MQFLWSTLQSTLDPMEMETLSDVVGLEIIDKLETVQSEITFLKEIMDDMDNQAISENNKLNSASVASMSSSLFSVLSASKDRQLAISRIKMLMGQVKSHSIIMPPKDKRKAMEKIDLEKIDFDLNCFRLESLDLKGLRNEMIKELLRLVDLCDQFRKRIEEKSDHCRETLDECNVSQAPLSELKRISKALEDQIYQEKNLELLESYQRKKPNPLPPLLINPKTPNSERPVNTFHRRITNKGK